MYCAKLDEKGMHLKNGLITVLYLTIVVNAFGQGGNDRMMKIDVNEILRMEDETLAIIKLDSVLNEISDYGQQIARLTEAQKVFLIVENLEREVNNGGFNQFFFNSAGEFAHETVTALRAIGAFKTANVVLKAISVWPYQQVPKDRSKRRMMMEEMSERASIVWEECDEKFYVYEDKIGSLLLEYVKMNRSDF